jgi:glycosyltransferase involved in cell wall biosynthesis
VSATTDPPGVAILPWGLLVEDFIDRDGISLETFSTEFVGSWVFGYAEALRRVGLRAVVICVSARVPHRLELHHRPSGATVVTLPAPAVYGALRRRMLSPYGRSARDVFGDVRGARFLLPLLAAAKEVAPYLATPLRPLARELRRQRCRAVLVQEYEFPRFDVCSLLGRLIRIPTFGVFQGGDYQRWHVERVIRPLTLRAGTGLIIAPGDEAARVSSRYGVPASRIARIPNPLDPDDWAGGDLAASRRDLGIPQTSLVMAWHGRVAIWKKGLDLLVEARRLLAAALPQEHVVLLLLGAGRDDDRLDELLQDADPTEVKWLRRLENDRARIADVLAAANVYAFPSRHEGFPVALVEALAAGLPVVASDVHGAREIVGEGDEAAGVVVSRGDAGELADALRRLLEDEPLRSRLARRARARVRSHFSLEAVGAQLSDLLVGRQIDPNTTRLRSRA